MSYNVCNPFFSPVARTTRSYDRSSKIPSRFTGSISTDETGRTGTGGTDSLAQDVTGNRAFDLSIDSRRTPLHDAVMAGDFSAVQRLLALGRSRINLADRRGFTALHHAVNLGDPRMVRLLLSNGAIKSINTPAFAGFTPLALCCNAAEGKGSSEIARMLLGEGADADVYVRGFGAASYSPLHLAAIKGHADIVQTLINSGVNVNQTLERSNITALALARDFGRQNVVEVLCNAGGVESSPTTGFPPDPRYSDRSIRRGASAQAQMTPFQEVQFRMRQRAQMDAQANARSDNEAKRKKSDTEVTSPE